MTGFLSITFFTCWVERDFADFLLVSLCPTEIETMSLCHFLQEILHDAVYDDAVVVHNDEGQPIRSDEGVSSPAVCQAFTPLSRTTRCIMLTRNLCTASNYYEAASKFKFKGSSASLHQPNLLCSFSWEHIAEFFISQCILFPIHHGPRQGELAFCHQCHKKRWYM